MKKLLILTLFALLACLSPQAATAAPSLDVRAPSIYISYTSPSADRVGSDLHVGVVATDDDRVTQVEYLIDGSVVATATGSPWDLALDMREVSEGVHQLQARAFDPTGNNGITAPLEVNVDHTAPEIEFVAPVEATNAARPEFTFAPKSDDFWNAGCVIELPGEYRDYYECEPGEPFGEEIAEEGAYDFVVYARDDAGNRGAARHRFIVDRTAPEVELTSGPGNGQLLDSGSVSFGWTAEDELAVTQTCAWDGGPAEACDRAVTRDLAPGEHTFRVLVTDRAGNETALHRWVVVRQNAGPGGPGEPETPAADTVAPVVELAAAKQRLKTLKRGLKVRVACSEACSGSLVAKPAQPTAATRGVKFAGQASLAAAGTTLVVLKPTAKTRRILNRLAASTRTLKLTATSTLSDLAGNPARASVRTKTRP